MINITLRDELETEKTVTVALNEFVAHLKAICQGLFPYTAGKLLTLRYGGVELEDSSCIGDYAMKKKGCVIDLSVSPRQPYSKVNYLKVVSGFVREGRQRSLSEFYSPGDESSWDGKWTKGDEYLSYPPVDVNNPWSAIAPSQSRELTFSPSGQNSRPRPSDNQQYSRGSGISSGSGISFAHAIGAKVHRGGSKADTQARQQQDGVNGDTFFDTDMDLEGKMAAETQTRGRSFHSLYICNVRGFTFSVIHKMEGKWSGTAIHTGLDLFRHKQEPHACSSKVFFDATQQSWIEKQLFTNKVGMSNSRTFHYIPQSNGALYAEADDPEFMEETTMKIEELGSNVLVLTAVNITTGQVVVTETITCSSDFHSRVRTVQRFDSFGELYGIIICKEKKVLDTETGALTTFS